jgi:hypothetical protein
MTGGRLRLGQFAAAPNQSVLLPAVSSTLFPRLTRRSRRAFQVGLAVVVTTLLILSALRIAPALIAVGAVGIPLLFVLYLRQSGALREIPRHLLVVAATLGAGLGVAGMLTTGELVANSYDISVTAGMAMNKYLRHGLALPLGAAMLELLPALAARALSRPPRKALDGFVIGALGALAFSSAATLTRLAPQFALGMIASHRSFAGLIVEAAISGLTVPLTAAAAGGTAGVAMWFTPSPDASRTARRRTRAALAALTVAVVSIFIGVAVTDAAGLAQLHVLFLHIALAVAAGLVLRLSLQIALLHEAAARNPQPPPYCGFCGAPLPDEKFCPACGVAVAALPPAGQPETHAGRLVGVWTLGNAAVAVALIAVSLLVTTKPQRYTCPPDCGRPPIGTPVKDLPRYTAEDGGFSVTYPAEGSAYEVTTDSTGVSARWKAGDGGVLKLFAEPAAGRGPRDIAMALLKKKIPDATIAYEIPNAMVGYQPGYGAVADRWPPSSGASYIRLRIIVVVAVKNDLALVAAAVGPFHEFGPTFGPGPPSGANLEIAQDMGKYVNSFRWKGDPAD